MLLANGANVNARNKGGYTPLGFAESGHKLDGAELLRQHGGHQ